MAEWTNKNVLKLIELLREREALWNSKHPMYKDRSTRYDLLMEIAVPLGHEKEEIERKLKNLHSHFTREVKKEELSRKSGSDYVYKSKWFAYQSMTFLKDKHKPRRTFKVEDEESQEQLIILVQGYNELYDTSDPNYSDHSRKKIIWDEIGKIMNKSGNECEENWRFLQEGFRKYIQAQDPLDQGSSKDKSFTFGKIMSFMKSHLLQGDQNNSYSMDEESETPCIIYFDDVNETNTSTSQKRKSTPADVWQEDVEPKRTKPNSADSFKEDITKQTKPSCSDHLAKYFQSIEETCRTLSPGLQIMVKTQISQIIHRAEMENLNLPTSSSPHVNF